MQLFLNEIDMLLLWERGHRMYLLQRSTSIHETRIGDFTIVDNSSFDFDRIKIQKSQLVNSPLCINTHSMISLRKPMFRIRHHHFIQPHVSCQLQSEVFYSACSNRWTALFSELPWQGLQQQKMNTLILGSIRHLCALLKTHWKHLSQSSDFLSVLPFWCKTGKSLLFWKHFNVKKTKIHRVTTFFQERNRRDLLFPSKRHNTKRIHWNYWVFIQKIVPSIDHNET